MKKEVKKMNKLRAFIKGEEGLETTEYALLLVLLAIVAVTAAKTLGTAISGQFNNVSNSVNSGNVA